VKKQSRKEDSNGDRGSYTGHMQINDSEKENEVAAAILIIATEPGR